LIQSCPNNTGLHRTRKPVNPRFQREPQSTLNWDSIGACTEVTVEARITSGSVDMALSAVDNRTIAVFVPARRPAGPAPLGTGGAEVRPDCAIRADSGLRYALRKHIGGRHLL